MAERKLRLDDETIQKLLDRLDTGGARPTAGGSGDRGGRERSKSARRDDRYSYRIRGMKVEIDQPGAPAVTYLVPSRNISASGCSFLLGNFVYPKTRCTVHLINSRNNWEIVPAQIVRCRYLEGSCSVYEVGARFDNAIDVARFSSQAVRSTVLMIDDSVSMHRLAARMLEASNVRFTATVNPDEGIAAALATPFDLILLDLEMPGKDGFAVIAELRTKGYTGAVIACTGLTTTEQIDKCIAAGCDGHVPKPFTRNMLEEKIRWVQDRSLLSTLAEESDLTELIDEFVHDLKARLTEIVGFVQHSAHAELEAAARALKSEAGSFGFQPISDVAQQIEALAAAKAAQAEITTHLKELLKLGASARPATGTVL